MRRGGCRRTSRRRSRTSDLIPLPPTTFCFPPMQLDIFPMLRQPERSRQLSPRRHVKQCCDMERRYIESLRERITAHRPHHRGRSVGRACAVRHACAARLLSGLPPERGCGEGARSHAGHFHPRVQQAFTVSWGCGVFNLAPPDRGFGGVEREAKRRPRFYARSPSTRRARSNSGPEADPDLKECIARAVDKSSMLRERRTMHDIDGYTHAEIAGILGVPEGTSKVVFGSESTTAAGPRRIQG